MQRGVERVETGCTSSSFRALPGQSGSESKAADRRTSVVDRLCLAVPGN